MSRMEKIVNATSIVAALSAATIAAVVVHRELKGGSAGAAQSQILDARPIADWRNYARDGHQLGSAGGRVSIVEFGDYECPACGAFNRIVNSVESAHPGQISLVYRHWPLSYHRFSYPAAVAGECAGRQDRFLAYHRLLFEHQDSLGLISFTDFARRAKVADIPSFEACMRQPRPNPKIEADIAAAKQLGAHGTPALVVNGSLVAQLPDSTDLVRLIDQSGRSARIVGTH